MQTRLPRSLLHLLAAMGAISLAVGGYLDYRQSRFLAAHPITTNLLSGVIGFSFAALFVAVVFNRFHANDEQDRKARALALMLCAIIKVRGGEDYNLKVWPDGNCRFRFGRLHELLPKYGWRQYSMHSSLFSEHGIRKVNELVAAINSSSAAFGVNMFAPQFRKPDYSYSKSDEARWKEFCVTLADTVEKIESVPEYGNLCRKSKYAETDSENFVEFRYVPVFLNFRWGDRSVG